MSRLKLAFIIAVTILMTAAILQNTDPLRLHLLFFSFAIPKALLLGVVLGIGWAIGWISRYRFRR